MRLAFVACLALCSAAPIAAQRDARLQIALSKTGAEGAVPSVSATRVLDDRSLTDLLHSGFPARLHYRLELWASGGLFDNLQRHAEWDVIVRYNPLERRYSATRIEGDRVTSLGSSTRMAGVDSALAKPFVPKIAPPAGHGRYYWTGTLDVEMLSVNDLDEVERWLRGELTPAVHGEKNPGTALGRGVTTLITRVLGGKQRHYEARTREYRE
ncbi:MAG TPA: hypothetical protein VLD17_16655 [Gemmatimonadaceae bacterium]|nr:hypothetical protein [Gemmatimonadaceae bacterium]